MRSKPDKPPLIFGDGQQSMDFVYVEDVARANILAACSDVDDDVFNIGTGVQTSLLSCADLCCALPGSSLQPEHREARSVGNVQRRRAAIEKAAKDARVPCRRVAAGRASAQLIRWRQRIRKAAPCVVEA